jgi:hypothetical protein
MILTAENYYSREANREYLSVSQYKDFVGTLGKVGCEECALAKIDGKWEDETTTALLVGSYVDAHFEGTLDIFKAKHPELFKRDGGLKTEYVRAEEIINRIERDDYFMKFMSGQKQVIMTAELFGAKWKIKIDSYIENIAIVDLKVMENINKCFYVKDYGYMDFTQYWGYDIQGAVYQEVVYQNTGKRLPFYIAAASKEKEPNIEIIQIDDQHLKEKLYEVEQNTPKIIALKNKEIEPMRCGLCDWCKHTKVLTKPIHFSELIGEV